jgi:hypothetical protein
MKTAMQEALIKLRQLRDDCDDYDYKSIYSLAIVTLNEYLEKEKEQIIDAYYGNIDGVFGYREEGQEYYNQTYNQNK